MSERYEKTGGGRVLGAMTAAFGGLFAVGLLSAVAGLARPADDLHGAVLDRVDESGVSHPVTAVLLNFRAFDTLLEIGVVLLALFAVWSIAPPQGRIVAEGAASLPTGPVLEAFLQIFLPTLVVAAGYLLWRGAEAPGGAFQAGALLAAAGVMLLVTATPFPLAIPAALLRAAILAGFGVFGLIGAATAAAGREFLDYPPAYAKVLILTIEAAAAVSIGLALVHLFRGGLFTTRGE